MRACRPGSRTKAELRDRMAAAEYANFFVLSEKILSFCTDFAYYYPIIGVGGRLYVQVVTTVRRVHMRCVRRGRCSGAGNAVTRRPASLGLRRVWTGCLKSRWPGALLEPSVAQERSLSRGVVVLDAQGRREQAQSCRSLGGESVPPLPSPAVVAASHFETDASGELAVMKRGEHR
jgi:hypothetical protein